MIKGNMVAREINFEEKRVYVPTPMVQEPFFTLSVVVVPTVQDSVVTSSVVSSHVATLNEHEEPVVQDPIEPVITHEEEQQQPHIEQASTNKAPRRSQRVRKLAIFCSWTHALEADISFFSSQICFAAFFSRGKNVFLTVS